MCGVNMYERFKAIEATFTTLLKFINRILPENYTNIKSIDLKVTPVDFMQ